jgi:cell division transport system permease protein
VEGFVLGAAGALIPIVFLYFSYAKVMNYLTVNYGSSLGTSISLLTTHTVFVKLIPLCFLIGIGIGLAGSYLTLRRQLKKIN